jgi:beta-glucosidase
MSRATVLCSLALVTSVAGAHAAGQAAPAAPGKPAAPSMTAEESAIRARANALLAKMTPEEKAGQLTQYFYFTFGNMKDAPEKELKAGRVGSLLFVTDPKETNRLQHMAVDETRLKIPLLFGFDVIHGFRTIFPVPIAMAASWDPALVERAQGVAAAEARAVGIHWAFAPMLDIARDPRWGRIIEGPGEDPFLASAIAAAQVRGFQGASIGTADHIIAGPKHYAGYGASLGGRDYDEVNLSDSEFWNVYVQPFAAAVKAGAGNIMAAYMPLNGVPAAGNKWLLTDVLRGALKFKGFVVSDANGVTSLETQHFAKDKADAALRAIDAGLDMEMNLGGAAFKTLPDSLAHGQVAAAVVDAAVRRVLEAKIRMGLFEHPYVDEARATTVLGDPAHREAARVAAERSAVLLRNDGSVLPLKGDVTSIAVIGPFGDAPRETIGPWSFNFTLDETVTILAGIRAKAGAGVNVQFAPGVLLPKRKFPSPFAMLFPGTPAPKNFDEKAEFDKAVTLALSADVSVLVLGETQEMIGEQASRSSIALPEGQQRLLDAVVATGKPVVLLLMNGRPLDLRGASKVPAILDIWYPGTQGGTAVANLLFGAASPGGKLPFSWLRDVGQVPTIYARQTSQAPDAAGKRYFDEESTPLFPFGFGLSYTTFAFDNLKLDRTTATTGDTVKVSVDVKNTGSRAGDEVVQLYMHQRYGSASRPVRELKGFERVTLGPGESKTVTFSLGPEERRYWSAATRGWVNEASKFDVWVGGDSNATLTAGFEVTAKKAVAPAH